MTSPSDKKRLAGCAAVVTGGGSGIGRQICLALAARGARVAPVSRTADDLLAVGAEIVAAGGEAPGRTMTADVSSYAEVAGVADRVTADWGAVDILVVAAGVAEFGPLADLDPAEWERQVGTNLTGAFHTVRAFIGPMLEARRGHVITLGSVAGRKFFAGGSAYGASKFGLRGLTGVLREEVRQHGVRVTEIIAGATETPIWGGNLPVPEKRMMNPATIADAVVSAVTADDRAVIEEILLRPALGDF